MVVTLDMEGGCHVNHGYRAELPIIRILHHEDHDNHVDSDSLQGKFSVIDCDTSSTNGHVINGDDSPLSVRNAASDRSDTHSTRSYRGLCPSSRTTSIKYIMEPELLELSELEMDRCGWGWAVVAAATLCNGTVFGVLLSFGVLFKNMLGTLSEEFNMDTKYMALQAALVGSVADGCAFLFSPITGVLMDRFSPRKVAMLGCLIAALGMFCTAFVRRVELLYLTYGLILGVGSSLIMTPTMVMPALYFERHLGLVNGLSTCGNAIFTAVLPFLWVTLLEKFVMKTFMILSIFYVLCFIASLTFVSRKDESENKSSCAGLKIDKRLWRNRNFLIWLLAIILSHFTMYVPIVHLVNHTSLVVGDEQHPEVVQTIFGAVSCISRLVIGPVSDTRHMRKHRLRFHQASFLLGGFTTLCIPFGRELWHLYIFSVFLGLAQSLMIAQFAPVIIDLVGVKNSAKGVGFTMGCLSLPLMAAPAIGGALYDTFGNYTVAFHVAGVPGILASFVLVFIKESLMEEPESEVADLRPVPGTPVMSRPLTERRNSRNTTSLAGQHPIPTERLYARRSSMANIAFH